MRAFAASPLLGRVGAIRSSGETKVIEAAGILAGGLLQPVRIDADLHENDRSATGFLPEFERTADATCVSAWRNTFSSACAINPRVIVRQT
jgi:hypothetical protein